MSAAPGEVDAMTSEEFDRHYEHYLSGSLTRESSAMLCSSLSDPRWQKRWRELSDLDGMLAGEFGVKESAVEESEDIKEARRPRKTVRRVDFSHRRSQSTSIWIAAAAILLLVLLGIYLKNAPQTPPAIPSVAMLEEVSGAVTLLGGETAASAQNGIALTERDGIQTAAGSRATVRFPDGTRISLSSEMQTRLWLHAPRETATPHGKLLTLDAGSIDASVAPQPPGMPMRIHTPNAAVKIVGTQFRLSANPASARLDVREGRVEMQRLSDGKAVDVNGGWFAVASADTDLIAKPIAPVAPVVAEAKPAPAKLASRPIFNGKDLSGWTISRGKWKVENGIIVGHASPGDRARIASTESFENFEMTCKLRVTGTRLAELQYGGYRHFFQLNWETPGTWKDVTLRVRGKEIRATLDGKEQQIEKGYDEDEVPKGLISFYTTERGTLEIKDAQITELKK
jgi:ferric-dicitrate binding protein FerR (iron transport regulator)